MNNACHCALVKHQSADIFELPSMEELDVQYKNQIDIDINFIQA